MDISFYDVVLWLWYCGIELYTYLIFNLLLGLLSRLGLLDCSLVRTVCWKHLEAETIIQTLTEFVYKS